jgi:hypothetical protein
LKQISWLLDDAGDIALADKHWAPCWHNLSGHYPPYRACLRRFWQWVRSSVFRQIEAIANDLSDHGGRDLSECHIEGTFVIAKKGAAVLTESSVGNMQRSWQYQTMMVFLACLLRRMKSPLLKMLSPSVLSLVRIPRV